MSDRPSRKASRSELEAIEAPLFAFLDDLAIEFVVHRHPPLFTVEDSQDLRGDHPGAHVKNMFMKDKKGGLWLITCLEDRRIKIRDLEKTLGAPKMSFGKPDLMTETIGVAPGAVTPLAVLNDRDAKAVSVVLDASILDVDLVNCHPLHNEATVGLRPQDLLRVFEATGHTAKLIDFNALEAAARAVSESR